MRKQKKKKSNMLYMTHDSTNVLTNLATRAVSNKYIHVRRGDFILAKIICYIKLLLRI